MTAEQSPEIVAAASLSPLSPAPIPLHTTSPTLVPKLQDHAAAIDAVIALQEPVPPFQPDSSYKYNPLATMVTNHAPDADAAENEISDTIVVGGDYNSEEDDSFEYDEDEDEVEVEDEDEDQEEGQEQKDESEPAEPGNDEYEKTEKTSDSAAEQNHADEAGKAQPDVSNASSESILTIASSAPDSMKSQSPVAPSASVLPSQPASQPTAQPRTNGLHEGQVEGEHLQLSVAPAPASAPESPVESVSAAPNASPSASVAPNAPAPAKEEEMPDAPAPKSPSPARSPATASASAEADESEAAVDIQKLVDQITERATGSSDPSASSSLTQTQTQPTQATSAPNQTAAPSSTTLNVSPSASLPPKPSVTQQLSHLPAIPQANSFQSRGHSAVATPATSVPPTTGDMYMSGGHPESHARHINHVGGGAASNLYAPSSQQAWEKFQVDEERYTTEAKWERFPEGSRIFIGNLSSERVSKREVFDVFHKFGRLAQISLKNAYGFVQYHTAAEGQYALQNAQGIELGGRKIHLEISRTQKKKDDDSRSPTRGRNQRGDRNNRASTDRFDWRRDDYRSGRSPSPRGGHRGSAFSRDRDSRGGFSAMDRRRSRSPPRFGGSGGRFDTDSYRRRSPSPPSHHADHTRSDNRFDTPQRHGADVPDVQFLLLQEVSREFVAWVQQAFSAKGLKTNVMHVNPRFPRDTLVQQQVLEGVHAIVDLDYASQAQGKIPIQVFIRRQPGESVKFEMYQGLDPSIAAELVLREKALPPAPPAVPGYASYPYPPALPHQYPTQPAPPVADVANIVGQLDNASLQALLASLQPHQAAAAAVAPAPHAPMPPPQQQPQIDINALLGGLRNTAAAPPAAVPGGYAGYGGYGPVPGVGGAVPAGGQVPPDATQRQVQTIIEQLKRATQ